MAGFSIIDIVILGIIALSVFTGLVRGLVKEVVALVVWVVAIWLGVTYCQDVGEYFRSYVSNDSARVALGFVIILLLTILAGSLFNAFLGFILKSTGLTGTDRVLGMGFGFVRGIILVSLIILTIQMTSLFPREEILNKSHLYTKFTPVVNWLYGLMPNFIKKVKTVESSTQ